MGKKIQICSAPTLLFGTPLLETHFCQFCGDQNIFMVCSTDFLLAIMCLQKRIMIMQLICVRHCVFEERMTTFHFELIPNRL